MKPPLSRFRCHLRAVAWESRQHFFFAAAAERISLAELCRYKRLYVKSVQFYAEAVKADPKLAASPGFERHYGAVRSAALAGCGEGEDTAGAPANVRASLRGHAVKWLRVNLADRTRRLEGGTPQGQPEAHSVLHIWRNDPALAGVRDAGRLAALPPKERAAWQPSRPPSCAGC